MSSRNHRRKRHPFVRLIRSILRLIRAILRPKRRLAKSIDRRTSFDRLPADFDRVAPDLPPEIVTAPAIVTKDPFLETIGEVFDRVQWQMLPTPPPVKVSAPPQTVRTNLASPSDGSLETVGELLDRVKWQLPTATIAEKVPSTSSGAIRTHDVSLN